MSYRDVPMSTEACPSCREQIPTGSQICPACRNPVDLDKLTELRVKVKPDLRRGRMYMGFLTMVSALVFAIEWATGRSMIFSSPFSTLVPVVYFGGCFVVARWMPLGASIAAMALFLFGEIAALAEGDLHFAVSGIGFKGLALIAIVGGIRAGYRVRDLRGQWRKRDLVLGMVVLVASTLAGLLFGFSRG